ncbi:MAG: TonB-dependent receptor [Henriciella sp.]
MKSIGQKLSTALAMSVASAALVVPTVHAQSDDEASNSRILDKVTVTAQQREQSLQDVPISLQVVSADNLEALAADDIGDIDVFIPGLEVSNGSPTQPRYRIRGVSTSDFGVGTDPAVGIYVDGVYAARSGASLLALNDVERIEVIKGPQGTLFGRNSAAGAVSITTRKPSDEFEAELGVRFGEFDKRRVEGLINLPISDTLALRFNGVINQRDGIFEDAVTGEDYKREDNWALKGALRWDVTPDTRAILSYTHDELDQDARPAIGIVNIPDAPGQPPVPVDTDTYLNPFNVDIRNDVIGNSETRELDEIVLSISHDFNGITLTSLSSYRTFDTNNREDEDGTNRIDLYFDTNNVESNESFYQEFRAAGETGAFNWIIGTSFYDEQADQRSDTFTFTDTVNTTLGNVGAGTPFTDLEFGLLVPFDAPGTVLGHGWAENMINSGDFQAFAVFGDVIWQATDKLSLTAGVRYTKDEKSFTWLNGPRIAPELDANLQALDQAGVLGVAGVSPDDFGFDFIFDLSSLAGVPCDNGVTIREGVTCQLDDDWSDVSPRFVADYKINDDVLLYASYAKGYKAGGFNSVEVASRFDNEDVTNFEFGVKSTFPEAGVRFNASAFQYVYKDKQAIRLVAEAGGSGIPQYLVETSDEEAFGLDLQLEWAATDELFLFGNAQYIDATFKERVTRSGTDLSGEPTGEPEWSFAVGGNYTFDLGANGEIDLLASHAYTGERRCNSEALTQGDCLGFPAFAVGKSQERTDIRVFWNSDSGRYKVGAFVNNLFDNQYVGGVNNLTSATLGTPFVSLTEPQTWGVDLKWTY